MGHPLLWCLEVEHRLEEDAAVACGVGAEAVSGQRLGFAEEGGVQHAVWRSSVDDVEDVEGRGDDGQAVFAGDAGVELGGGLSAAEAASTDASASSSAAEAAVRGAFNLRADSEGFADAHVQRDVGGAGADAVGNDGLALANGVGVEASVGSGNDIGCSAGAVGGTGVELVIAGKVVADGEVVGCS